ncbi:MAG: hypothetical protein HY017_19255 [Betaproteobacteria bacterium]|nr:hypothetical protein [Betaproteobacteria bacterium]
MNTPFSTESLDSERLTRQRESAGVDAYAYLFAVVLLVALVAVPVLFRILEVLHRI